MLYITIALKLPNNKPPRKNLTRNQDQRHPNLRMSILPRIKQVPNPTTPVTRTKNSALPQRVNKPKTRTPIRVIVLHKIPGAKQSLHPLMTPDSLTSHTFKVTHHTAVPYLPQLRGILHTLR